MAQLVGALFHIPKGRGSIPGQGKCLGCWFDSPVEVHKGGNQSMFFFLSPPLSLKIKKYILRW